MGTLLKCFIWTVTATMVNVGILFSYNFIKSNSTDDKKLLMGIFSVAAHDDIRQALRETWLSSRYACPYYEYYRPWLSRTKKDCAIYYAFVFGNNTVVSEPDALMLPIEENMNKGKTFEWFRFAVKRFPEFNYIAKADQVFTLIISFVPLFIL